MDLISEVINQSISIYWTSKIPVECCINIDSEIDRLIKTEDYEECEFLQRTNFIKIELCKLSAAEFDSKRSYFRVIDF